MTRTKLVLGDPPANGGGGGGGGERGGDGNNVQGIERTKDRVTYVCMLLMLHSLDACMHTNTRTHTMLFLFLLSLIYKTVFYPNAEPVYPQPQL